MTAHERVELRDDGESELSPITDREQTAAVRREVGRCARAAWDALQRTLTSFARAKSEATDRGMVETGQACDVALMELDRLERALRSLRAELMALRRASRIADAPPPQ